MIQYRLGAFGFLSSEGVHKYGKTNAGLLDMRFALEWVQEHIGKFGGNSSRVTIAGESSGAGSAVLQSMAYGGREDHLFNNVSHTAMTSETVQLTCIGYCRQPVYHVLASVRR
jgi:Carboxylesterase type B